VETTYELYVLTAGRWRLESRFEATRREDAIRTAKMIEAHGCGAPVRLVREVFDRGSQQARESIVYDGNRRREVRDWRRTRDSSLPGPYAGLFDAADPSSGTIRLSPAAAAAALGKLAAIAAASFAIAVMAAVVHRGMLSVLA
jgi:hypothetical protein